MLMNKVSFSRFTGGVREFNILLTEPGESGPIFIPRGVNYIFVSLDVVGGEGLVQFTNSNVADVHADTAVWKPWSKGTQITDSDDHLYPCTAIRMKNISGSTHMYGGAR